MAKVESVIMDLRLRWKVKSLVRPLLLAVFGLSSTGMPLLANEPVELNNEPQRIATEDLIEGIKSSDGRWFEVEIIVFERIKEQPNRESFDNVISNFKPKNYWELFGSVLNPNLQNYLFNLPLCWQHLDPFQVKKEGTPPTAPSEFFSQFERYQNIISGDYKISDQLCLTPDERLSITWQILTNQTEKPLRINNALPNKTIPKRITGGDYDDFHDVYLIAQQNLKLTEHFAKLEANKNLNPLLHMGWRQPGLAKSKAKAVYIRAGKNYSADFRYNGSPKSGAAKSALAIEQETKAEIFGSELGQNDLTNTAAVDSVLRQVEQTNVELFMEKLQNGAEVDFKNSTLVFPKKNEFPDETWQVDGAITVHLDHYLYLDAKFNYRQPLRQTINPDDFIDSLDPLLTTFADDRGTDNGEASTSVVISAMKNDAQQMTNIANDGKLQLTVLKPYPLEQFRRTYSGDLHYIDHPKFGILFQIRKYRH